MHPTVYCCKLQRRLLARAARMHDCDFQKTTGVTAQAYIPLTHHTLFAYIMFADQLANVSEFHGLPQTM